MYSSVNNLARTFHANLLIFKYGLWFMQHTVLFSTLPICDVVGDTQQPGEERVRFFQLAHIEIHSHEGFWRGLFGSVFVEKLLKILLDHR
jgi:hypothetical protein